MCGLGAILRTDGGTVRDEWLDTLAGRVAHRGPDGAGRFRDRVEVTRDGRMVVAEVGLVHHRLSIIDPADGAQPMVSERGRADGESRLAVVFNG